MILPMYTESERKDLKKELNKLISHLDKIEDVESDSYKKKYEEALNLYEIINDL